MTLKLPDGYSIDRLRRHVLFDSAWELDVYHNGDRVFRMYKRLIPNKLAPAYYAADFSQKPTKHQFDTLSDMITIMITKHRLGVI